jgi:hypothetical protein
LHLSGEILVVHEVTNGPFDKAQTVLAPFAPLEDDASAALAYRRRLAGDLAAFRSSGRS